MRSRAILRRLMLASTALVPLGLAAAAANPLAPSVVGGGATVTGVGTSSVTVNQSTPRAIINWNSFNIGAGETTRFVQPDASAIALNRVTGGLGPSTINGMLTANGRVFLVNPDGVMISRSGVINTAGFLATSNDISNDNFMAGRYHFNIPGRPSASIVNEGRINAHSQGFAALVAPGVRNSGTITARYGKIGLAAGNDFSLDFYGDQLITLAVGDSIKATVRDVATGQPLSALVKNDGKLKATGGRVELTAAQARTVVDSVINNSGVIEARSVGTRNGKIVLGGSTTQVAGLPPQTVKVSGKLDVSNTSGKGGKIQVTGEKIVVKAASFDASGSTGGGTVLIGGDTGGGASHWAVASIPQAALEAKAVPNATTVEIDAATVINASATSVGNGGKVIVWADGETTFAGQIAARGGDSGGNGGFVEVSGKQTLSYLGNTDTRASFGAFGTLLLDPGNLTIQNGGSNSFTGSNTADSTLDVAILNSALGSSNVIVQTGTVAGFNVGDIIVNAQILWSAATTLTLSAYRNIQINDTGPSGTIRNTGGGSLILRADLTGTGTGTIDMPNSTSAIRVDWTASSGTIKTYYNPASYTSPTDFTVNDGTPPGGRFTVASASQLTSYMLVNSVANLTSMRANPGQTRTYALGKDIDAASFAPTSGSNLSGVLDGHGGLRDANGNLINHTISNLTLGPNLNPVGLFNFIEPTGVVRNLKFSNVNISATSNLLFLGTVAGENKGTIDNVQVLSGVINGGPVNGVSFTGIIAGGLVGINRGVNATISNSSSTANVSVGNSGSNGTNIAGGLVGSNQALITTSSAGGIISGGSNSTVGGLVGQNGLNGGGAGTITSSFATGAVTGGFAVGGLVGQTWANSTITGSNAKGNVTLNFPGGGSFPGGYAGGLVGVNQGLIDQSFYNTGTVSGSGIGNANPSLSQFVSVGGLVGENFTGGTVRNSNAAPANIAGNVGNFGGLVGSNFGTVTGTSAGSVFANATFTVGGFNSAIGGLVGNNAGSGVIHNANATGSVAVTNPALFSRIGGLVGYNQNGGQIGHSTANVTVTGGVGLAGGLVGQNEGSIELSSAAGNVSSATSNAAVGGLVGFNMPGATITDFFATGNVVASGSVPPVNCADGAGNCQMVHAGGLVGTNAGTINSSVVGNFTTFASGNVSVGSNGVGGGFVGVNYGIIGDDFGGLATGTVTGAAGVAGADESLNRHTVLGGFAGRNHGLIDMSSATIGQVGSPGVDRLTAGGFVGANSGVILSSNAARAVRTGTNSVAGGFVGAGDTKQNCTNCVPGDGSLLYNNLNIIALSSATGPVTVGTSSLAGGFAGAGSFMFDTHATGAVTGGANSILGGFVGVHNVDGLIFQSTATGPVTATGPNAWIGGFVGYNGGGIFESTTSAAVNATSDSILGGFFAVNVGWIGGATSTGPVFASGANNVIGGFGGANFGLVDSSTSTGAATGAGANNIVGGFLGANAEFSNFSVGFIPDSSFPVGVVSNSSGSGTASGGPGSTVKPQIGVEKPSTLPSYPSIITGCHDVLCQIFQTGALAGLPIQPPVEPDPVIPNQVLAPLLEPIVPNQVQAPPTTQLLQFRTEPQQPADALIKLTSLTTTTTTTATQQPGTSRQTTGPGSQTPGRPPVSLAPVLPSRPTCGAGGQCTSYATLLPPGQFIANQVVVQISQSTPPQVIQQILAQMGLTVLGSQPLTSTGNTALNLQLPPGVSLRDVILRLEQNQVVAIAQANMKYGLVQQVPAAIAPFTASRGDPAQYTMGKLQLNEAHRVASGNNIIVAVIDSEVDRDHAELAGTISQRFDATDSEPKAHSHGTAMAGAIVSRERLLGVAPGAKILAVRAFSEAQGSTESTSFTILKGIEWAISQGARVINMSFAGPYDPSLERALKDAAAKGIVLVGATGNAGPKSPPLWPGADPNVIAVTATDSGDKVFRQANRGPYVSVASPGVEILAPAPQAAYQLSTGTSIATAHVSGVIALMLERDPTLTPLDVRLILESTANDLGPKGRDTQFGWGLVNPAKAIAMVDERKRQKGTTSAPPATTPVQR